MEYYEVTIEGMLIRLVKYFVAFGGKSVRLHDKERGAIIRLRAM